MEFRKNDLLNEVLINYYKTFSLTLDTSDFVPEKFNHEIRKILFKEMKKKFKLVNREYKKQNKEIAFLNKTTTYFMKKFSKIFFRRRKKDVEKNNTNDLLNELTLIDSESSNKSSETSKNVSE